MYEESEKRALLPKRKNNGPDRLAKRKRIWKTRKEDRRRKVV